MSSEPRKRTRVACDTCRKKKIRCDGRPRCLNCELANEKVCHYEERPPKKPRVGRNRKVSGRNMEVLNSRISRLENVILSLTEKLGASNDALNKPARTLTDDLADEDSNTDDDLADSDTSLASDLSEFVHRNPVKSEKTPKLDKVAKSERALNLKQMELFFGTHSFLSIFSVSSLEWIRVQLGEENQHIMKPLKNMPMIFQAKAKLFLQKWTDPAPMDADHINKLLCTPFPENLAAVLDLINTHYRSILLFHNLADFEEIKRMFETYYANKNPRKRIFNTSQLLKMTLVLLTSLIGKTESFLRSAASTPSATSSHSSSDYFSSETIMEWQDELMSTAVFYYFRSCVLCEGLETIEAFLLFTIYLERNSITPEIAYMILSLAIRFAQQLGLHRIETYDSIPPDLSYKRSRVWLMCSFMDVEMCFRSGRIPLINYHDVSPRLQTQDLSQFLKLDKKFEYLHLVFYGIFKIRLNSYNRLFSATANLDSLEALQESLNFLNSEMHSVAMQLPVNQRPVFYNDPAFVPFVDVPTEDEETRLSAFLSYFTHMMVVNRLPSMFSFPQADEETLEMYRDISLNSARTVLHLVRQVNRHTLNESFVTWSMFFPLSAFLHLLAACMNQPNSADAFNDLNLMIDISRNFVGRATNHKKLGYFAKLEISTLLQVVFKTVLKITITIFEKKTGLVILEGNDSLKAHLDLPSQLFPELYADTEDFRASIMSHMMNFNAKLPFAADNKYSPVISNSSPTPTMFVQGASKANVSSVTTPPARQNFPDYNVYSTSPAINPGMTDDLLYGTTYLVEDSIYNTQLNQFPNFFLDNNIPF